MSTTKTYLERCKELGIERPSSLESGFKPEFFCVGMHQERLNPDATYERVNPNKKLEDLTHLNPPSSAKSHEIMSSWWNELSKAKQRQIIEKRRTSFYSKKKGY